MTGHGDFDWRWYRSIMDFKERVRDTIRDGLQKVAADEQARSDFKDWWSSFQTTVWSILHEVKAAKEEDDDIHYVGFQPIQENGRTVLQMIYTQGNPERNHLRFSPDGKHCRIRCETDPKHLMTEESFDRESFTEEVVRDKVTAFIESVFEAKMKQVAAPLKAGVF